MPYCAIMTCKNESRVKNLTSGGVSYHRFPKDPYIKEKWIDATGRQNWMPGKLSTICSLHFDEESIQISKKGNRYINKKAIPTQKILIFQDQNGSGIRCEPGTSQKRPQETPPLPISEHLIIYQDENDTEVRCEPGISQELSQETPPLPIQEHLIIFEDENDTEIRCQPGISQELSQEMPPLPIQEHLIIFEDEHDIEIKSEPGTPPKRLQETPEFPIFFSVTTPTDSPPVVRFTDSPTNSAQRKKTLGMLRWTHSKIRQQSLKIKALQTQNRRLKSIIKNMEERIKSLQDKYEN